MTQREIANLCCRVLALYVLVQGLSQAPHALALAFPLFDSMYLGWRTVIELVIRALPPLILIATGGFLWRWSRLIAAWMVGHDLQDALDEPDNHKSVTRDEIHCIAFSTVGLWVLAQSIPTGIGIAMQMLAMGLRSTDPEALWATGWWVTAIVDVLLRTVLGLYLLFGASGLMKILRGAKNFGLEKSETPEHARKEDVDRESVDNHRA